MQRDDLHKIHQQALIEFDRIYEACNEERKQAIQDRRFCSIAGAQWEDEFGEQFENRPKLEVNKIHLSVIRIVSEYRSNRISVDFVSRNGEENDSMADACDDLYRADEQDSAAEEAYDNAFEEAVTGGFGAWRLRADYENDEDPEDDRQRICIEPIYDADSCVYFDLDAKRSDKSDARHAFLLYSMTRDLYIEKYGDDPTSWPVDDYQSEFDWADTDDVSVAEYYKIEDRKTKLYTYETLTGEEEKYTDEDFENDPELIDMLNAVGSRLVRERTIIKKKVHKYLLSGGGVIEDMGIIAGSCIPIVPVYGKRWYVSGIERFMGHVRLAKDVQRLKNMQLSKLAELSAESSTEKPILTPEQIAGHEVMWAEDNIKRYPYVLVNPIIDANGNLQPAGPVGYLRAPQVAPALAACIQISDADQKELLGNDQAMEQLRSNVSAEAIQLTQSRFDARAFIYMSNMAKAIKRSGEIWLSMAKDILVEPGRKMKTVDKTGKIGNIEINKLALDKKTGEEKRINDFSDAKYDVVVDVGPSSTSKRESVVREITEMMSIPGISQEDLTLLSALKLMNLDGEGFDDIREFYRKKLVRLGAVKPTDEEKEMLAREMQMQQPDPQSLWMQASAEAEKAKAAKTLAEVEYTMAKTDETRAKTVETLSDVDKSDAAESAQKMSTMVPGRPMTTERGV